MSDFGEPWSVRKNPAWAGDVHDECFDIRTADDADAFHACDNCGAFMGDEAVYRRLVAAINATAGIPTEVLEKLAANGQKLAAVTYDFEPDCHIVERLSPPETQA